MAIRQQCICKRSTRRKTRNRAALQSITKFMMSTKSMSREKEGESENLCVRVCVVCMWRERKFVSLHFVDYRGDF